MWLHSLAVVVALLASPHAAASASQQTAEPQPTHEQLVLEGVNELGVVPVLMYHAFTSDPELVDMWTRHVDEFWNDLQWLYDHNFHVISLRDLIENTIDVPLGKHPVVLTFDDASVGQFIFEQNADGELVPRRKSGVGVMEAFFAAHPDFGRGGHFGIVPANCFAFDEDVPFNTRDDCPAKLAYLQEHGYEVGNHTWWHHNLNLATPEELRQQVGDAALFIDTHVSGPANMSRLLTLPFGEQPIPGSQGDTDLHNGFQWEGEWIEVEGMLRVSGGPAFSPSSSWWDPMEITRLNTDQETLDYWFPAFERGEVHLYTSDGNPNTVTIPDPVPEYLANELDRVLIESQGKILVSYPI
jgi:peptidoglycan/xylan/chitin deacetylase (PgdA/CDA1 family)